MLVTRESPGPCPICGTAHCACTGAAGSSEGVGKTRGVIVQRMFTQRDGGTIIMEPTVKAASEIGPTRYTGSGTEQLHGPVTGGVQVEQPAAAAPETPVVEPLPGWATSEPEQPEPGTDTAAAAKPPSRRRRGAADKAK